jgi:hypothetical protein
VSWQLDAAQDGVRKARRSFRWSFHQGTRGVTERYLLDDAYDLSCKDSTCQHALDGCLLSCKQQAPASA